ncbi:MAG: hypothetical protein L6Q57_05820 [Alphaproteobacteria bacterium]|nr:hypothetical protein [Alphaproteobacteria bacterium]
MMFPLSEKPDMAAHFYANLIDLASEAKRGTDAMRVIQHIAGVMVETAMVFDEVDASLQASFKKLAQLLDCEMRMGALGSESLPPPHTLEFECEKGRQAARLFFEDWLDCSYEFHDLFITIIHNIIVGWEGHLMPRQESLRLLYECARRCLSFEIAAQELCDVVIERKVAAQRWSLADCVAGLAAVAGRRLALSLNAETCALFRGAELPENLDKIVFVMTQEATRLGVPAGSNWRFGLAANDTPLNPPLALVNGVEPYCRSFFEAIDVRCVYTQAVACAKAAGRMLAVASGGEIPELEPAIAKPLAMMAMTETYKAVCMEGRAVSL